jgi:hypothetical protein
VGSPAHEVNAGDRCGIAWRLGKSIPCPEGGCTLLLTLGFPPREAACPEDEACPARAVSDRAGFDPDVVSAAVEALGYTSDAEACPVEAIAQRAGFDPVVVRTLDEVRQELDRVGVAQSAAKATRTRPDRHEAALERWPVVS